MQQRRKIDIFLSRPTQVGEEFKEGLNNFIRLLESYHLTPKTIGTSDYPSDSPLDEVISFMKQCKGAITLGYSQITITKGLLKGKEIKEEMLLPTEWNHIETSLAYAMGLPILLIHHTNIKRGVFDRGAINKFLYEIDLKNPNWALDEKILGALKSWLPKVESFTHKSALIQERSREKLSSEYVVIGTLMRKTLSVKIKAKIILNDNIKPDVDIFLERVNMGSPYCPKCNRPLSRKRASWKADYLQIGYQCESCKTEYKGTNKDVLNDILAEIRLNYDEYWDVYQHEIQKLTKGHPEKYKIT